MEKDDQHMGQVDFFAEELREYFAGTSMPDELFRVVSLPPGSLGLVDAMTYNACVGPYREKIRAALARRFLETGEPGELWASQLQSGSRSIAGQLAAEAIGLSQPDSLPLSITVPAAPVYYPATGKGRRFSRVALRMPSKKGLITGVAVLLALLLAIGGLSFYAHATAPSRALRHANDEFASGDYGEAYRDYERIYEDYYDRPQADEARLKMYEAAYAYAEELKADGDFKQAIEYYDLAVGYEVNRGAADSRFGWARQLETAGDYEAAFEQCEEILAGAPSDYDWYAVMDLRAEILYLWGESYMQQGQYAPAASRFNKCLSEFPDGRLAGGVMPLFVDCMVSTYSQKPPTSKKASAAGESEVRISNPSGTYQRVYFSGPGSTYVDLPPGSSTTAHLTPGWYDILLAAPYDEIQPILDSLDCRKPTSSGYYWEMTLPSLTWDGTVTEAGVSYEEIVARAEQLKAGLPPEIAQYLGDVEYMPGGENSLSMDRTRGMTFPARDIVYFNAGLISPDEVDNTIFHEWGHILSYSCLSNNEREEYMELRGILEGTPWDDKSNYMASVEEDFCEVFSAVFGNTGWEGYTIYGAVADPDQMKQFFLEIVR